MNNEELIALIEAEWDLDNGFLGRLRQGQFDRACYSRCSQALERIQREVRNGDSMSRRLVSLLWYIPLFMSWQAERVKGSIDAQEYQRIANQIEGKLEEILGVP